MFAIERSTNLFYRLSAGFRYLNGLKKPSVLYFGTVAPILRPGVVDLIAGQSVEAWLLGANLRSDRHQTKPIDTVSGLKI